MKKQIKKERYEKLSAACEPFRRAKAETIHTLAGIGRKHRMLRYPIWIMLVVYIFIYNVILYGCIQLKIREKFARGVALVMTLALVFTSVDFTVFAATRNGDSGAESQSVITAFAELDDSVAAQSLPIGAEESEISFPAALTVTLETEPEADTEQEESTTEPEESTTEPEESTTEPEEGTTEPEESTTEPEEGTTEPEEGTTEPEKGTEPEENTEPEESATPEESTLPEESITSEESTTPEESITPEESTEAEESASGDMSTDMPMDSAAPAVPESSGDHSNNKSDDSPDDTNIVSSVIDFLLPEPMVVHAAELNENTSAKSDVLIDVTWKLDADASTSAAFDSSEAGNSYVYVPVIPEGYTVAEGVSLPQITITIQEMKETAVGQTSASQICGWHFGEENVFPEGALFCDNGGYSLVLAGGSSEVQIPFEEIVSHLPTNVILEYSSPEAKTEEMFSIAGWSCPEYTADEEGNLPYSGSFFFKALLSENGEGEAYKDWEGAGQIGVSLIFDAPMMTAAVTAMPDTTITSNEEWGEQTLSAGTYTINSGVTVTVSGRLTVSGNVTIKGGGNLLRADSYDIGTSGNYGDKGTLLYVNGGTLTMENITIDGNSMNAYGPAIYIKSGTVNMNSGSVVQNNYNMNNSSDDTGSYAGGGVYCGTSGTLNINDGAIKNCKTSGTIGSSVYTHAGGGVYLKGTCKMISGSITGNSASNGGGIYLASSGAELDMTGGTISGNKTNTDGVGNGIYYSTENDATSVFKMSGAASVQDVIYLDNKNGTLCPTIMSALCHRITLDCSSKTEGRVLLRGEGYTLTTEDTRMVSMQNTNLSSKLDSVNNRIYLSTETCAHSNMLQVAAKEATCLAAGNRAYWQCSECNRLFSDAAGTTFTTFETVKIAQKSHSYTYAANNEIITERCGNGCSHSATAKLTLSGESLTYTGQPLEPASIEYSGDKWMGTAPTIEYENNTDVGDAAAKMTVAEQTASKTFIITAITLTGVTVNGYEGVYDGNPHDITVTAPEGAIVKYGISESSCTEDTSPAYANVGTYTVYYQVTKDHYQAVTGSAKVEISPYSIKNATVTLSSDTLTYNGSTQTKGVNSVMAGGRMLTEGTDYEVSGNTGTAAGTYTITITGKGNYDGSKEVTYEIGRKTLTGGAITIVSGPYSYTGSEIKPAVTVKDGEKTLVKDTDYTISYENNTEPGTAKVTVTGICNYTGTLSGNFTIEYSPIPSGKSLTDYVTISPQSNGDGWYGSDITLMPKDGCSVGENPANIETDAVTISQETGTGASTKTIYIKDKDGKIYRTEFPYKLDKTPPAVDLTDMTVENGTKGLWNWIIGKKSMIIKIPDSCITESLSGIAEVSYTAVPENGGAGKSGTIDAKNDTYEIDLDEEFSGTIKLTVKDKAGNTTQVTLPVENGKVIAEDYAPVVRFTLSDTSKPNENGWYNTQIAITVTVTDDKSNGNEAVISGGIATIIWKDGENGTEQTVADLPVNAPVYEHEFTISVDTDGTHTYYVKAVDNAGNESGWQTVTVKVDTGKPEFAGSLTITNPTVEGTDITFTSSEGGKVYYVVSDTGAAPTAQEVKEQSGQKGGVQNVEKDTVGSFTIKGLTSGEKHTVYVVLEDAAGKLSEVRTESFLTLQKAPEITPRQLVVDYTKETITLPDTIGEVEVYINPDNPSESRVTQNADGSLPVTPGTAIYIRFAARTIDGMTIPASDKTTIQIPDRPVPTDKQVTVTENAITLTNPDSKEEYVLVKKGETPDWRDAGNTGKFTGLDVDTEYDLYVRIKATENNFVSVPIKLELRTKDHTLKKMEAEEPTCTETGNKEYWTCSVCGKLFSDSECTKEVTAEEVKKAALGHDWSGDWVVKRQPTATEDGVEETTCTHGCGEKKQRAIPVIGDGKGWSGVIISDGVEIVGYSGSDTAAEVPSEIDGQPVTAIGENAFDEHAEITSVTIPGSVTAIGEDAFSGCTGLTTIMIPEGLKDLDTTNAGITDTAAKIIYRVDENGTITITSVTPGTGNDGEKKPVTLPDTIGGQEPEISETVKEAMKNILHEHKGGAATCTQKAVCEICSEGYGELAEHDYEGSWQYDASGHWKSCSRCKAEDAKHSHHYDNDRDSMCNDCGYERVIKNTDIDDGDNPDDEQPTSPSPVQPTLQPKNPVQPTPQPTDTPDNKPESEQKPEDKQKPNDTPGQGSTEPAQMEEAQTVQVVIDSGKLTISGDLVTTGNIAETSKPITNLSVGDGEVIVKVVCEEESCTAGVKDTVAVTNAVLMPEQIQLVNDGETIEIRVDVKDISENVPAQDKEVTESGLTEYRKEVPDLTLGMYVDISMFIKVGEGDWNAVTSTDEPIEVVVGIPEELKEDGRTFYIIRSHDGVHTLLQDMDDNPDTITVSTDRFSAYAIAYDQTDKANVPMVESSAECGLCNICPTFLGICCFIWLAVIVAVFMLIGIVIWKKSKEEVN